MSLEYSSSATCMAWSSGSTSDTTFACDERPHLLLVDDEPANIEVLASVLQGDFSISFATDGSEALRLARIPPHPALILLDVMMQGMDGFQVFSRLKRNALTCRIPVIFLTALNDSTNRDRAIGMGAVDYIHKPFQPQSVKARVQMHVDLRRHVGPRYST